MNSDKAYELVKERIVSLELDPGMVINEIALARQVGMPPAPVNEALARLIDENWLERVGDGVKVTEDTMTGILRQLFEVRSVLEGLCARLAVERATEEQIAALEKMMPELEEAARRADPQGWIQLDQRFHEIINAAAGNLFLEESLARLYTLDMRIFYTILNRLTDLPRVVEGQRAIVTALRARDAREAERALTGHILDAQRLVLPGR